MGIVDRAAFVAQRAGAACLVHGISWIARAKATRLGRGLDGAWTWLGGAREVWSGCSGSLFDGRGAVMLPDSTVETLVGVIRSCGRGQRDGYGT